MLLLNKVVKNVFTQDYSMNRSGSRGMQSPDRRAFWRREWGCGYAPDFKYAQLSPLLESIERAGGLGKKILDAGSGSLSSMNNPSALLPAFYPTEGKRVVRADLGMPYPWRIIGGILEIRADLEDLSLESVRNRKNLIRICRHIGADPRLDIPTFDTLLLSDILNYVDYRRLVPELLRFLAPGGRLVICNWPDMGLPDAFSPKRPKGNRELSLFVASLGLLTEHLHYGGRHYGGPESAAWYSQPPYPYVDGRGYDCGNMMLVAQKPVTG